MQSCFLRTTFAVLVTVATCAFAQENDEGVSPNNVEKLPSTRPIIEYALAGGALIGALAIGFMPSKRTKDA
jgi:hypothetical protein